MRFIVLGVGAIGGTVAAALTSSGQEVVGIARGAQLEAIRSSGLMLHTPEGARRAHFACVAAPSDIDFRPDDVILLATKTQHTAAALDQLAAAGVTRQPVFCLQNGVENERLALRRFANVHGVTVMMPADFVTPGEVAAFGVPRHGIFDIGRFPAGSDDTDVAVADAFNAAQIAAFVVPDVMRSKYGKLLMNLGNIVDAALGPDADTKPIVARLRAEAETVLKAAGIPWRDVGASDPRRDELMRIAPIEGVTRTGSSSTQSLVRATGSIETDYLNGEIVLLGRLHGVPTPLNGWFLDLSVRMLRDGIVPGTVAREEIEAALAA